MLIENEFDVEAGPDEVLSLMLDIERVAPCLPGTQILDARPEGGYNGEMSIKLGPMKMRYRGSVEITDQDLQARTATLLAKGAETKGQGSAQGALTMTVVENDAGGSRVTVSADLKVTGRVAQMGQGIMQDVSARMIDDMAKNMEEVLSPQSSPVPAGEHSEQAEAAPPAATSDPARQPDVKLTAIIVTVIKGRWAAFKAWFRRLFRR